VDLLTVARRTPGFVGADLANVLNEAALLAAREDKDEVEMVDIEHAIDRIIAGLEKKNRLVHDGARDRRVPRGRPRHRRGACGARGPGAQDLDHPARRGGARLHAAAADGRALPDPAAELNDRIAVLLGGRAAEEIVFGEISTGAGNDLERATDIARRMVAELGMSPKLGPVNLVAAAERLFLQGRRTGTATTAKRRRA
jgi:cell division protease FtsH